MTTFYSNKTKIIIMSFQFRSEIKNNEMIVYSFRQPYLALRGCVGRTAKKDEKAKMKLYRRYVGGDCEKSKKSVNEDTQGIYEKIVALHTYQ